MANSKPKNVVVLIADSLRYDSVHPDGAPVGLDYTASNGVRFTQARSGGCWTLPATASLFTGLMPHEHGADTHSRGLRPGTPTLAGCLRELGFSTHQITANVATTEVFGLDSGFDEVRRIWQHVPAMHARIHQVLILVGKPRLRKKIMSTDFVMGKLSEDLEASKVWLQTTIDAIFDHARRVMRANSERGRRSFMFLNLMETHFPYHVAPTFKNSVDGLLDRVREVVALYHLVNQTWLTREQNPIRDAQMAVLRARQRAAWAMIAQRVDAFVRELHESGDNLVVFGSDHGDCFGEQGWAYHFSNVADAGNHVPLYYLGAHAPKQVDAAVSARDVFHAVLSDVGHPLGAHHIATEPERSLPIMQASWYNNQGRTLPRYKHDQFAFVEGAARYMHREGRWFYAPVRTGAVEPEFVAMSAGTSPIVEAVVPDRREALQAAFAGFRAFADEHNG